MISILSLLLVSLSASAQPSEVWGRTFGGESSDPGGSVQATSDGGFIMTGMTLSHDIGGGDLWLVKADGNGTEEWNSAFGGRSIEVGRSVRETADGGYIAVGYTKSWGLGNSDAWLLKVDAKGAEVWNRTYGGPGADEGTAVLPLDDGYVFAGQTESFGEDSDAWLVRTDLNGSEVWNRTYALAGSDHILCLAHTEGGGFILAGDAIVGENSDARVIKVASNGTEEWSRTFGGLRADTARSAIQTSDGGYALAGYSITGYSPDLLGDDSPTSDVLLAKLSHNGTEEWQMKFGGPGRDEGHALIETGDLGFILAGYTESSGEDALLMKTNGTGFEEWTLNLGGEGYQAADSIARTPDGYAVAGNGRRPGAYDIDIWLMRLREPSPTPSPAPPSGSGAPASPYTVSA